MGLAQKNSIMNRKTVHRHFGKFSIAALLLLLIAGCTPEETAVQESNNDDKILHAIIWQEEMQSRSVVTDIPGIKAEVRWEAGDKIGVFGTEKGKNLLFTIGTMAVLLRRNGIIVFMGVELMLNATNLALVTFSRMHGNLDGQVFAFFVMVVAAAEVVIGLAIIVAIFRTRRSASVDDVNLLRN